MALKFEPVYYREKQKLTTSQEQFDKDKLNIINPHGTAGIITLWNKPWEVYEQLRTNHSALFSLDSRLVVLTSLYGNGLPQMLANLIHNPQVEYLAVTGNDTKVVPSFTYLENFLRDGIENPKEGEELGKIKGTEYQIDPQLKPELLKHLKMQRFKLSDLEGLVNFVNQPPTYSPREDQRIKIKLIEPKFSDFPSDRTTHSIFIQTPLEAWMEVIHEINRFGKNIQIKKGIRRALYNLEVIVENPSPEPKEVLEKHGFDLSKLNAYRESILEGKLPEGTSYTYGNLLREHFGFDMLNEAALRLKKDPLDRRAFISLWDNSTHLKEHIESDSTVPCLTDLYFTDYEGRLMLTASFRTHNATSAWLLNLYGLRAIQEYVAQEAEAIPGRINVKSRWISIDPQDAKTNGAKKTVGKHRKKEINVNDPRGYFIINSVGEKIMAEHYGPNNQKLKTYEGKTAKEIKDQLRQDNTIENSDHAMWIGYSLAKAQLALYGTLDEL